MIIQIKPFDTLFFRDGKPFSMGDEVWASGIFPPPPSVIYGALRTAYFATHPQTLSKAQQADDPTRNLKVSFIGLAIGSQLFIPVGQDLVREKEEKSNQHFLSLESSHVWGSSPFMQGNVTHKSILRPGTIKPVEAYEKGSMISFRDLGRYLYPTKASGKKLLETQEMGNYLTKDSKTGIGRSRKTGSAEEGQLYRVEMLRMATASQSDISLVVQFEGLDLPSEGLLKLGGEAKACTYRSTDRFSFQLLTKNSFTGPFRLYLATPAIFKAGWKPNPISPNAPLEVMLNGIPVRLLGAAIDKPLFQGGFDIKKRAFKPMKRMVGAGSVFFCELLNPNQDADQAIIRLHGQCISDEKAREGYGLAYLGSVPS
ncbi:MAG: type III-B CRISPR module-associated protein Cmr3 [Bacteroidia bacterium]